MDDYASWFTNVTGHAHPWHWQTALAEGADCTDRLIAIPTGLGKTEGVLAAWMWNRVVRGGVDWPRRLVWCLPMRVLVEQTANTARRVVERMGSNEVDVHVLMGGTESDARRDWLLHPERAAVLVGTQDMLLSRALNRGYASARARWPMEYGLLNHDSLWIMDEVQLMDVGLATSVQLQAFRREEAGRALRGCCTWWMSATLQADWFVTVDSGSWMPQLEQGMLRVPADQRSGSLWRSAKPLQVRQIAATADTGSAELAGTVWEAHQAAGVVDTGRVTLAIVNRVDTATELHAALAKLLETVDTQPDLRLVHSRFRGLERRGWADPQSEDAFLLRKACEEPQTDRIIVATQVVEAGVDISATALVTELAPWPSLVQRFGRAARYGGVAEVTVVDRQLVDRDCLPYLSEDLDAAREAISQVDDAGLNSLVDFEDRLRAAQPDLLERLYVYDPVHLLTRRECDQLFDTSADLSGTDLDISRFIRSGEERDVLVCWVVPDWGDDSRPSPPPEVQPSREALCPVPVYQARSWLMAGNSRKANCLAWAWNYVENRWREVQSDDLYPGQVIMVDAGWGGYDPVLGFTGKKFTRRDPLIPVVGTLMEQDQSGATDTAQERDDLSQEEWKTIATHGREAADSVRCLCGELGLSGELVSLLDVAARVHDWGKAHPVFQYNIERGSPGHPERDDLAKAPQTAWLSHTAAAYGWPERNRDDCIPYGRRRGFRHEMASTLALFELLHRANAEHPALMGRYRDWVEAGIVELVVPAEILAKGTEIAGELAALDPGMFDLLAYLVCAHHGKVRCVWQSTPHDQEFRTPGLADESGPPLNGVREGDPLPGPELLSANGNLVDVPPLTLHLDPAAMGLSSRYGASWSERVGFLRETHGPFTLAFLEALLRVADIRASRLATTDPLLPKPEGVLA